MELTLGSLFDGISGFPLAGARLGIKTLWGSEIEPFPMKVSEIRFPDMKQLGDITKINGAEIEPVDIVTGGSPCQDLSVAGKRAGLAGERSGLFMEMIRVVKEMRERDRKAGNPIRPRFMVWENVPGAFSSNKGEDFRAVLEETARIADETVTIPRPPGGKWNTSGAIMADGWSIAWRVLDAQYWGVPQRRRRIFLVADFGGQSAPEILFKRPGLQRHIAEGEEAGQGTAADAERSVTTAGGKRVTATITATYGTKWNGNSGADTGDHFVLAESRETGEKVTAGTGAGVESTITFREVAGTLRANAGAPKHEADWEQLVCQGVSGDIAEGEEAREGAAADAERSVGKAIPINTQIATRGNRLGERTGFGIGNEGDPAYTIQEAHSHAVAIDSNCQPGVVDEVAKPLSAQPQLRHREDMDTLITQHYSVRRLTPLECERLQDFPDGWTDIPGASDSARYKALGNSLAVVCAEYVLEGIKSII